MIKEKNGNYYYDDDDGYPIADILIGPFGYDSEDKNLKTDNSIEFGKTAYYLLTALSLEGSDEEKDYTNENKGAADMDDILDAAKVRLITDSNSTSNLKIKEDLEEGKDLIKGIAVSKKKINDVGYYEHEAGSDLDDKFIADPDALALLQEYGFEEGKYYYMIALTIEDSSSVSDDDIIGTFTLSKSKKPKCDDIDFDFAINVDWEYSYRKDSDELVVTGDFEPVLAEKYYAMKFDCEIGRAHV